MARTPPYHQQVLASEYQLVPLVHSFDQLDYQTAVRPLGRIALLLYRDPRAQRVTDGNRFDEAYPIISVSKRLWIDLRCSQPDRDSENQRAVSDALLELLPFAPLRVHVVRIKVSTLAGVQDDVGLGKCPPERFPGGIQFVFVEVPGADHGLIEAPCRKHAAGEARRSLWRIFVAAWTFYT